MFEENKSVRIHKKRTLCEKESNKKSLEDRISKLPEDLICYNILSRLSTIDAVKTSTLSTKWRNLWKRVPNLSLHSAKFSTGNEFVSFIHKFFDFHKELLIRNFQLRIYESLCDEQWLRALYTDDYDSYVTQWIDVLTMHKIQHLDFSFGNHVDICIAMPVSLYTCETLVHLRLDGITMLDSKFVSLPCLKSIYLKHVVCPNLTILEKLISSSPVLEDLSIIASFFTNDDEKPLHLRSQTLERVHVYRLSYAIKLVVIDAPLLQCLKIEHDFGDTTMIIYSGFSTKVQAHVKLKYKYPCFNPNDFSLVQDLFTSISIVNDLVITRDGFEYIYRFLNVEPLPQMGYMSRLSVNLYASELKWFPTFLESCPNLKCLNLEWNAESNKMYMDQIKFEYVPGCLLSSLECVDIKTKVSRDATEVKVVKYFLDNALVLKKLTLRLNSHSRKYNIFKKIHKFPRRSKACQLLLL